MKDYQATDIRNVAIIGHGGDGKITLTEAMLFAAGATDRMGRVDDGAATTDYDPEEIKRKISISAGLAPLEWKDMKRFNGFYVWESLEKSSDHYGAKTTRKYTNMLYINVAFLKINLPPLAATPSIRYLRYDGTKILGAWR